MKKNTSKRSLLASLLALVMCVTMLVGTTFAWFTDSASVSVSKIEAGKLDIDVFYADTADGSEGSNWTLLTKDSDPLSFLRKDGEKLVQDKDILWEPNCTYSLPALKIVNNGNLALKYKVLITGIQGNSELNDVIDWTMKLGDADFVMGSEHSLAAKSGDTVNADILTIQGHMDADAGNHYQGMTIEGVSITVLATQDTVESDSFSNQYDEFAEYPDVTVKQIPAGDTATVNETVKDALASIPAGEDATQIVLPAGSTVSIDSGATKVPQGKSKNIKFTGTKDTTVALLGTNGTTSDAGKLSYQDGANLTFQGITYDAGKASGICARGGVVTFIDCTIKGEIKQTVGTKFVFSGCTFTSPISQLGYGCTDVVIDNCAFNTSGYGIKIYSEGSTPVNLTVKNSSFKNTSSTMEKSAIFLDHIIGGITYNITIDNCTFEGFTAAPTPNYNGYATRMIVTDSFVKTADGQYIFAYQTGITGGTGSNDGRFHKILTAEQLVVTVK